MCENHQKHFFIISKISIASSAQAVAVARSEPGRSGPPRLPVPPAPDGLPGCHHHPEAQALPALPTEQQTLAGQLSAANARLYNHDIGFALQALHLVAP